MLVKFKKRLYLSGNKPEADTYTITLYDEADVYSGLESIALSVHRYKHCGKQIHYIDLIGEIEKVLFK